MQKFVGLFVGTNSLYTYRCFSSNSFCGFPFAFFGLAWSYGITYLIRSGQHESHKIDGWNQYFVSGHLVCVLWIDSVNYKN
jgi:hypothetical protein